MNERLGEAFEALAERGQRVGAEAFVDRVEQQMALTEPVARQPLRNPDSDTVEELTVRRSATPVAIAAAVVVVGILVVGLVFRLTASTPLTTAEKVERFEQSFTWSRVPGDLPELFSQGMLGVVAGGPGFVAVGYWDENPGSGRWRPAVWTSADGTDWVPVANDQVLLDSPVGSHMQDVAEGGPGLVAVGHEGDTAVAWLSPDGLEWSAVDLPDSTATELNAVVAAGPGLVAAGSTLGPDGDRVVGVWTSVDGLSWSRVPHDPEVFGERTMPASARFEGITIRNLTQGGPGLVAVGHQSFTSTVSAGDGSSALKVGRSNSVMIWTSADGLEWERLDIDSEAFGAPGGQQVYSVVAGGPGFVAVGVEGAPGEQDGVVWTSSDGLTWARVPDPDSIFGGPGDQWITSLVAVDDGFVASGGVEVAGSAGGQFDALVWTSPDGLNWVRTPHDEAVLGGGFMGRLAVSGDRLVAVDEAGQTWIGTYSPSGSDPTTATSGDEVDTVSAADETIPPVSRRGLSCRNRSQKSMAFAEGDSPSSWFEFPEGTHMRATISLWDSGIHDEDPVETSERVFIEFDNGFVTDPTPDLPDDVSELAWGLGDHEIGDATQWRVVHAPDRSNGTPDSVHVIVELWGCVE